MQPPTEPNRSTARARGPRRLPATEMPVDRASRRWWSALSMLLHLLLVLWLIAPDSLHTGDVIEKPQGAGGPTAPGGGGGGRNGTGGVKEHVQFVAVTPPPAPAPQAVVLPPIALETPPIVIPPPQVKPPEPTPDVKPAELKIETKPAEATAPVAGVGGGTGRDGTAGNGPGTGGGVGTGNGTGRGSGTGPGTGGGNQANYPPTPTELFIPPLPMPDRVRGFHLIAEFDVDETGKVLGFTFTKTRDGGYNRRLDDVLKSFRFRAGTTPEGKPIRMKAQIIYDF